MRSNSHRAHLAKRFEEIFTRLLSSESGDPYAGELSDIFEVMANTLLKHPDRAFDGVSPLWTKCRSPRKVEFIGEMWILGGREGRDATESFHTTATDKRITNQGIWIQLSIGNDKAEAELSEALGITKQISSLP